MRYFNSASDLCLVDHSNAPYSPFFACVRNATTASSLFEHDIPLSINPLLCAITIAIALAPCTLPLFMPFSRSVQHLTIPRRYTTSASSFRFLAIYGVPFFDYDAQRC